MELINMSAIEWSKRKRPAAKYEGHDIRRSGSTEPDYRGYRRYYLECECGKQMGAWDFHAPFYAWTRHRKQLGLRSL